MIQRQNFLTSRILETQSSTFILRKASFLWLRIVTRLLRTATSLPLSTQISFIDRPELPSMSPISVFGAGKRYVLDLGTVSWNQYSANQTNLPSDYVPIRDHHALFPLQCKEKLKKGRTEAKIREKHLFLKVEWHFSSVENYSSNRDVMGENLLKNTPQRSLQLEATVCELWNSKASVFITWV